MFGSNVPVAFVAVKVSGSLACAPPVGDTTLGADAFSVEPSGAALESGVGAVGVGVDLLHAIATASMAVAAQRRTFRCMRWNSGKAR